MKGFYISVHNELLEKKHFKAMREAVWLYMWLLDKMTSITEEGVGIVLGGKPVTFEDVESHFGFTRRTYVDWVERLRVGGYISTERHVNGLSFTLFKAKKYFGNKDVMSKNRTSDVQKAAQQMSKKRTSTIYNTVDNTVDIPVDTPPTPFVFKEYLEEMKKDKQPSVRFIAHFFKVKKLTFNSKEQTQIAIKRHIRAANDVVKFGAEAVNKAIAECERMKSEDGIEWTIETVLKVLTK